MADVNLQSSNPWLQPYLGALSLLASGDPKVANSLLAGGELGSLLFANGLGRIDETLDPGSQELLDRYKAESFLGGNQMSPEVRQSLDMLGSAAQNAQSALPGTSSALGSLYGQGQNLISQGQGALDAANAQLATAGQLSPEMQQIWNLRNEQLGTATQLDPALQNTLSLYEQALGGLSTQEMAAARDLGTQGLNRSYQTALADLRAGQAGGPRGPASNIQALPLSQNYLQASGDLQKQLILEDYAAKQSALSRYGSLAQDIDAAKYARLAAATGALENTANTIDTNRFSRPQQALSLLGSLLGQQGGLITGQQGVMQAQQGLDQAQQQLAINAAGAYSTAAQNRQAFEIADRAARLDSYQNLYNSYRTDLMNRQIFNLNQMAREKSGLIGSIFGAGSFGESQQGRLESNDIAREALKAAQNFGAGGGEESSTPVNTGSTTGFAKPNL